MYIWEESRNPRIKIPGANPSYKVYVITLSCLEGREEFISRAGKGEPRPKILRTSSFSVRCKFMPEPKTWKTNRMTRIKLLRIQVVFFCFV